MTDPDLAARIAESAGQLLLGLRASGCSGQALGQRGDRDSNACILAALQSWRPDDAVLSEETFDDGVRLKKSRVWVVDPLDGTKEFSEGRSDWAVHVGLAVDGVASVGAVALPAQGRLFRSDTVTLPAQSRARPLMVVSRSRPPPETEALARLFDAEIAEMGSAGAKAMAVVAGEADIYYHDGGQHEWDNCAPAAVAGAAGLHVSRADGSPLIYNRANPFLPDLLICRRSLAARAIEGLKEFRGDQPRKSSQL